MMKSRLSLFALSLAWALAGCVTDYTKSEALSNLTVDAAQNRVDVAFVPGSARLAHPNAIQQLVTTGRIRPADRVTIAASGYSGLAEQRTAVISRELLSYGIVADPLPLATVPPNHAVIGIGRYTVTLPPCPNWSSPPQAEYTNAYYSNWGCAAATNLGLMVANPGDLVSGRTLAPADAMPAAAAVNRYLNDRIKQPPQPTASPFAPTSGGGGEGGGAPGGAPGAGVGAGAGTP